MMLMNDHDTVKYGIRLNINDRDCTPIDHPPCMLHAIRVPLYLSHIAKLHFPHLKSLRSSTLQVYLKRSWESITVFYFSYSPVRNQRIYIYLYILMPDGYVSKLSSSKITAH